MGTDIHAFVEYRQKDREDDDPWVAIRVPISRSYQFFEALAGVRGEGGGLCGGRGSPLGCSVEWDDEEYGRSWASFEEIEELKLCGHWGLADSLNLMTILAVMGYEVRFVFAFNC